MNRRAVASFLLDHNLSRHLLPPLRRLGHDALSARDLGLDRVDDDILLTVATDAGRILVTHNGGDFIVLHRVWRRWSRRRGAREEPAGILILPQRPALPNPDAADALNAIAARGALANELFEYRKPPANHWQRVVVFRRRSSSTARICRDPIEEGGPPA